MLGKEQCILASTLVLGGRRYRTDRGSLDMLKSKCSIILYTAGTDAMSSSSNGLLLNRTLPIGHISNGEFIFSKTKILQ